jgi:CRISPR-associated protein Cmr1
MFLAGADGSTPELRPSSIKGVLRFWWRAMHGDMAVAALRREESRIFGGVGEKAMRSSVTIKVGQHRPAKQKNQDIGLDQQQHPGIGYLLYSTIFVQKRDCFKPGSEFIISFSSYSLASLEAAVKAFACLVFFGGLGSRSRRGAGSVFVKGITGATTGFLGNIIKVFDTAGIITASQLAGHIETHIKPCIGISSAVGSYSALNGASLYVLDPTSDWKKALEDIGSKFKDVRNSIQSDIVGTTNFGIPIRHKSGLTLIVGTTYENSEHKWIAKKLSERRASPLIIKIIKTEDQCFFPIALHLYGELFPAGKMIIGKKAEELTSAGDRKANSDDTYIQTKFLSTLKAITANL